MKRLMIFVIAALSFAMPAQAAEEGELAYLAKGQKTVVVYLKDFTKECDSDLVSAESFKKCFEDAVLKRKSVKFATTKSPDSSDIQISCAIKKYLYSETDPITSFGGTATLLVDAVTLENYGEMIAEFTVTDTKTGKVIWKDSVKVFKKGKMTPEQSVLLVYDKASRAFLSKSFGKPK